MDKGTRTTNMEAFRAALLLFGGLVLLCLLGMMAIKFLMIVWEALFG